MGAEIAVTLVVTQNENNIGTIGRNGSQAGQK
jgi:tRNA C32,U32 (ribose-2'-O)-methylase TrmJ